MFKHGDRAMMTEKANDGRHGAIPWRMIGWSFALLLLLLPWTAMQLTDEVKWTAGDFIFAAIVFGTIGAVFELTVRMSRNLAYRAGIGLALAAALVIVWATGAVGMIGDEGNRYDLLFFGVIGLALGGAFVARLRAGGMALAMAVAGIAQILVAAGGLATDAKGALVSAGFALLWLVSAACFRKAARDQRAGTAREG
jgi:hypothetical protein